MTRRAHQVDDLEERTQWAKARRFKTAHVSGPSKVVQWLSPPSNSEDMDLILGQRTKIPSCTGATKPLHATTEPTGHNEWSAATAKILHAATKTRCTQINIFLKLKYYAWGWNFASRQGGIASRFTFSSESTVKPDKIYEMMFSRSYTQVTKDSDGCQIEMRKMSPVIVPTYLELSGYGSGRRKPGRLTGLPESGRWSFRASQEASFPWTWRDSSSGIFSWMLIKIFMWRNYLTLEKEPPKGWKRNNPWS